MGFLVQPAVGHIYLGKVGYEFKIVGRSYFREEILTCDLGPATWDLARRCGMHAIQSFLIVVLCAFVWLTIILGFVLAEEMTIFDKDWWVKERIQDGKTHEMSRQGAKAAKVKRISPEDFSSSLWP